MVGANCELVGAVTDQVPRRKLARGRTGATLARAAAQLPGTGSDGLGARRYSWSA